MYESATCLLTSQYVSVKYAIKIFLLIFITRGITVLKLSTVPGFHLQITYHYMGVSQMKTVKLR
jgi:hypothetical protein